MFVEIRENLTNLPKRRVCNFAIRHVAAPNRFFVQSKRHDYGFVALTKTHVCVSEFESGAFKENSFAVPADSSTSRLRSRPVYGFRFTERSDRCDQPYLYRGPLEFRVGREKTDTFSVNVVGVT